MRPDGLIAELLLSPSERASADRAFRVSGPQRQAILDALSVVDGTLHAQGQPIKSAWRLSGVLSLLPGWEGLGRITTLHLRADPDWAPDFGSLGVMTSLRTLRLSLSRHPIPALPPGLRSLRLDLPGTLDLVHPTLEALHLYGAAQSTLPDWSALPRLERLSLERLDHLLRVDSLPLGLQRLELMDLPELQDLPELDGTLRLKILRCPKLLT